MIRLRTDEPPPPFPPHRHRLRNPKGRRSLQQRGRASARRSPWQTSCNQHSLSVFVARARVCSRLGPTLEDHLNRKPDATRASPSGAAQLRPRTRRRAQDASDRAGVIHPEGSVRPGSVLRNRPAAQEVGPPVAGRGMIRRTPQGIQIPSGEAARPKGVGACASAALPAFLGAIGRCRRVLFARRTRPTLPWTPSRLLDLARAQGARADAPALHPGPRPRRRRRGRAQGRGGGEQVPPLRRASAATGLDRRGLAGGAPRAAQPARRDPRPSSASARRSSGRSASGRPPAACRSSPKR